MNTPTRAHVTTAALLLAVTLTGCATSSPGEVPSASTVRSADGAAGPSRSSEPTVSVAPTPSSQPVAPSFAQHVYDECRTGAAESGVTLTYTPDPHGMVAADGTYRIVYPFRFDDGHTDPWAVYECTLSDDTVHSSYVGASLGDTH